MFFLESLGKAAHLVRTRLNESPMTNLDLSSLSSELLDDKSAPLLLSHHVEQCKQFEIELDRLKTKYSSLNSDDKGKISGKYIASRIRTLESLIEDFQKEITRRVTQPGKEYSPK